MSLNAAAIQKAIVDALHSSKNLAREPDDFLNQLVLKHDLKNEALAHAVEAVYKNVYYSFSKDLVLDDLEKRKLEHVTRLLQISEKEAASLNYDVGLAIYKKRFREFLSSGELSKADQEHLDQVAKAFGLHKRHIKKAISRHALAHYSFVLARSLNDGVLSVDEMAELENVYRRFGLTSADVSSVSIPDKKEILRASLVSIKAKGKIDDEDRDYIRSLAHYLNAKDLLKPCLMDLDLYSKLFAIRRGELPNLEPDNLILDRSERLHQVSDATYETLSGGRAHRTKGTLYVGTFKLRFVGPRRSHELRYTNILEVSFVDQRSPKLIVAVSSGKGSGTYRLTKKNSPAALLELKELIAFLIRKARKMIEPAGRASPYIPADVGSEVWHRDEGACVLCNAREYLEYDHIIPRSKGGDTSVGNLQLLCRKCNSEKSDQI